VQSQVKFKGSGDSGEGLGSFGAKKVPEKVWEALVRFNRVLKKVPERVWEALVQSQVRFNKKGSRGLGGFGAEPGQVQQGSGEGSGGLGLLGHVHLHGCARDGRGDSNSGRALVQRRRFWRRFWEALVQSQVRFNRVPEKVPEKGYGAEPCQVQQGFGESSGEGGGFGAEPH